MTSTLAVLVVVGLIMGLLYAALVVFTDSKDGRR